MRTPPETLCDRTGETVWEALSSSLRMATELIGHIDFRKWRGGGCLGGRTGWTSVTISAWQWQTMTGRPVIAPFNHLIAVHRQVDPDDTMVRVLIEKLEPGCDVVHYVAP